ncbi:hypothetical protein HDU93_008785 [Gonapodya sp. JEL0774]|nr:hypothetical protein HDU93_008785 [Gonapodya sp. JEL0774]
MSEHNITGLVKPGFEKILQVFEGNFTDREVPELGASVVFYYKGERVVELVGGWADSAQTIPYTKDTVHCVHSSGKPLMAIAILHAISQGLVAFDTKVASIWPDFEEGGKADVTVGDILSHHGGVSWVDEDHVPSLQELLDQDALAKRIAGQPHNFAGNPVKSYHGITRGWTGKTTVGELMRTIGSKLGVPIFIGLPVAEDHRWCPIEWTENCKAQIKILRSLVGSPPYNMYIQTRIRDIPLPDENVLQSNVREILRGQTPSTWTCTNGYGLAALANIMANGGRAPEIDFILDEKVYEIAHELEPRNQGAPDPGFGFPIRTTRAGWERSRSGMRIPHICLDVTKPPPRPTYPEEWKGEGWEWDGWYGLGGSAIQWDRSRQCAYGYAPNRLYAGAGNNDLRIAKCVCE